MYRRPINLEDLELINTNNNHPLKRSQALQNFSHPPRSLPPVCLHYKHTRRHDTHSEGGGNYLEADKVSI